MKNSFRTYFDDLPEAPQDFRDNTDEITEIINLSPQLPYQVPPPMGGSPGGVIISDDGDDEAEGEGVDPKLKKSIKI